MKIMKNPTLAFILYLAIFTATAFNASMTLKAFIYGIDVPAWQSVFFPLQVFSVFFSGFKLFKIVDEKS